MCHLQSFREFQGTLQRIIGPLVGSLLGALRRQISAQFGTLMASWFQSASQAPKSSHFGSLWGVFWEHFGCVFCITFNTKCNAFVQDYGGFSSYFWWHIVNSVSYYILFCYVLSCSCLPCRRGGGRAARRGRRPQKLLRTCKHKIIISVASVSARPVSLTVVKHLFLQCSCLERASRSLAKTGLLIFQKWLPRPNHSAHMKGIEMLCKTTLSKRP